MPAGAAPSALDRLGELYEKLEAFFAAARARHGEAITCHAGCDDCCRRRFSVTAIEAEPLAQALAALPDDRRRELARRARDGDPGVCPALDPDGRCAVYEARPSICRTHGLPIRFTPSTMGLRSAKPSSAPNPARSLPIVDACPKNFAGLDLAALPAASVLDQTTLSTVLAALDAARAAETGRPRGERVEIAALLAKAP